MPVLLVTGGGKGIGAATARLAIERGYRVCISYRRDAPADIDGAVAIRADSSVETDVVRLFQEIDQHVGQVDALVNNAATHETQMLLDQGCQSDPCAIGQRSPSAYEPVASSEYD